MTLFSKKMFFPINSISKNDFISYDFDKKRVKRPLLPFTRPIKKENRLGPVRFQFYASVICFGIVENIHDKDKNIYDNAENIHDKAENKLHLHQIENTSGLHSKAIILCL